MPTLHSIQLMPWWSGSRVNTSTGQQRTGDDQPSRPVAHPLRRQAPRGKQVSPGCAKI